MTYQEFNQKIFDFYQARSTSSFCILSITQKEIEAIIPLDQLGKFWQLRSSWTNLLNSRNGLPQYFGLLAIQCFAASLMQSDQSNSASAYRVRLSQLLKIDDEQELQNLFRGDNSSSPIQEDMWYHAKEYFKRNFHQELDIPLRTTYSGRFVQYPKSQALLNLEDLKCFTPFFASEFHPGEEVPFLYFKQQLDSGWANLEITWRIWELLNESQKKEKCWQQLYEFFNTWTGNVYDTSRGKLSETIPRTVAQKSHAILLTFGPKNPKFHLIDQRTSAILDEVDAESLFQLQTITCYHKGLFIFSPIDYPNEFESGRFIYEGQDCYLLVNKDLPNAVQQFLEKNNLGKIVLEKNYVLYAYHHQKHNSPFSRFVQIKNPVQLKGGIRTCRKKKFLVQFGPSIHCAQPFRVIFNNQPYDYNSELAECGFYRVRVDNYKDIEFQIVPISNVSTTVISKGKGWNLAQYTISEEFNIEGLCSRDLPLRNVYQIREWLRLNLQVKKENLISKNILLHAINNTKL